MAKRLVSATAGMLPTGYIALFSECVRLHPHNEFRKYHDGQDFPSTALDDCLRE